MRKVELRMNEKEKYDVIKDLVDHNGNKECAVLKLGITKRQVNRLIVKYKENGKSSFIHGNRGWIPSTALEKSVSETIILLYTTKYQVFNFSHFKDYLEVEENIHVSYKFIYDTLRKADILSPKARKKTKKDHGRTEKREYFLVYDTNKIKDKIKWKTVKALLYVKVQREENDELKVTDNYYIIDYEIDIDEAEKVVRDHWSIECGLHWKLDVILDEDHSRNRKDNSIKNLSIVRKIVFNLASFDTNFWKVPLQRKLTRYMLDFKNIEKLIFEVIPSLNCCQ